MDRDNYNGILSPSERNTLKGKTVKTICTLALVIITIFSLLPLIWSLLSGFKSEQEFYALPPTFIPKEFVWSNFTQLFTVYKLHKYVLNSVILILGTLVVELVSSATGGYVLSKLNPIGGRLIYKLILWTMMMPGTLSLVPLFLIFLDFPLIHVNMMNTYFPMWIIAGANCFHLMLFKDFFDGIPKSYLEAAWIDGAGKLQTFYRIILPLSKPIIATVAVFTIMASWNNFLMPYLIIKDKALQPLALAVYKFQATQPQKLLMSIVMIVPIVFVYFISQRFIVNNSNSEGDKG